MTINQLSIFLENKTGRLNEVTRILGTNQINIQAFSLAENQDFGILRMIVNNVDLAVKVLKENHFGVTMTEVICFACPNTPNALAKVLDYLAKENVFIEYMYAFSQGETAIVVIRPTDIEKCITTLSEHQCELLNHSNLYQL